MHGDPHCSEGADSADIYSVAAGDCSLHLKPRFDGVCRIYAEQQAELSIEAGTCMDGTVVTRRGRCWALAAHE